MFIRMPLHSWGKDHKVYYHLLKRDSKWQSVITDKYKHTNTGYVKYDTDIGLLLSRHSKVSPLLRGAFSSK